MTWFEYLADLHLPFTRARREIGKPWSLTRADFAELTGVFKTAHKKP